MLDMLALIQLFRLCSERIALHFEFLLAQRNFSPIRRTLKRFCVRLPLIVLGGSGLWAVFRNTFPRLFKEWKVVDRESSALKYVAVVKLGVGAVHNARSPVWLSGNGGDGSGGVGS